MTDKITLPLEPEDMVEYFKNKDKKYLVDYEASIENMQSPRFMLMYIANLGIVCDVDVITDELLVEYMRMKDVTEIVNLRMVHANVLFFGKYEYVLYVDNEDAAIGSYDADDLTRVIQANPHLVLTQMALLNSLPLFIFSRHGASSEDEHGLEDVRNSLPDGVLIDNTLHEDIGFAILRLFTLEDFLLMYLAKNVEVTSQIYFTRYFEEYMFSGRNLFYYINRDANAYMNLIRLATTSLTDATAKETLTALIDNATEIATAAGWEDESEG